MAAGTIYVYARDGIGSSSAGSRGLGGQVDTGHVFVTVRDNERGEQLDVDVWQGEDGRMVVNETVDQERRDNHNVVAFDVDRATLDRAMAAADEFHERCETYEILNWNCTDATEFVLSQTPLPIDDYTFPASVFNAIKELGEAGELDNYWYNFCDPPPDHSGPDTGRPPDDGNDN